MSALDISIRAQIINLLNTLRLDYHLSLFFISHDLSIVKQISDRVMVMYLGKIIESGDTDSLYRNPKHPYTQLLIKSVPVPSPGHRQSVDFSRLSTELPSLVNPLSGCFFYRRCSIARERCLTDPPMLKKIENSSTGRLVACHYATPGDSD